MVFILIVRVFFTLKIFSFSTILVSLRWIKFLFLSLESSFLNIVTYTVLCVTLQIFIYSMYYMSEERAFSYFFVVLVLFVSSIVILLLSRRVFLIFLGWDGLGVSSFFLIMFYSNWKRLNNRIITILRNRFGDGLILLLFSFLLFTPFTNAGYLSCLPVALVLFTAITKRAQVPFSAWLPAAMAAPTPISALVHSSTLVTAGVILILKFWAVSRLLLPLFFLSQVGLLTILFAGLGAINEIDFKKIVALSTLSQIGMLFFSLGVQNKWICLVHLCSHAFFKRLLFLIVGAYLHFILCQQDKRKFSFTQMHRFMVFLTITTTLLSLCGLFFLAGFFSKDIIFEFYTKRVRSLPLFSIFLVGLFLTFFYSLRLLQSLLRAGRASVFFVKVSLSLVSCFSMLLVIRIIFTLLFSINFFSAFFFFSFIEKYFLLRFLLLFFLVSFVIENIKNIFLLSSKFYLDTITLRLAEINYKLLKKIEKSGFEKINMGFIFLLFKKIKISKNFVLFFFFFSVFFTLLV